MGVLLLALVIAAILGSGLMAGLFFVFSNTVMAALGRLPAAQGMAAMQSINTTILNPLFLSLFMGTALLCLLVIVVAALRWEEAGSWMLIAGGTAYVAGAFLVTMVFNVPLNNQLAALAASDPTSQEAWAGYLGTWMPWNHVRTIACIAALLLETLGLVRMAPRLLA